jgi:hypothetical protein
VNHFSTPQPTFADQFLTANILIRSCDQYVEMLKLFDAPNYNQSVLPQQLNHMKRTFKAAIEAHVGKLQEQDQRRILSLLSSMTDIEPSALRLTLPEIIDKAENLKKIAKSYTE